MWCEEAVVWLCPPYSLSPSLSTNHGRCCFDIPGLCLAPLEYRTITGLAFKAWLRPHPSPGAWLICPRAGAGLHPHSSDFHRRLRLSVLSLEFILDQAIRRAEAQRHRCRTQCPAQGVLPWQQEVAWKRLYRGWCRPQPFAPTVHKLQRQPE